MEYRVLGKTGLRVSVFSVGTWHLSGPVTLDGRADGFPDVGAADAINLIRQCGELGINSIDTAEIYGDGEGERRVGQAIATHRDRWIVTTKFGMRVGPHGERVVDTSPRGIRPSLERSLARLRTDHVDVFLYHAIPSSDSIAEGRQELERLRESGKIRAFGISTDAPGAVAELAARGDCSVVQFSRSLLHRPGKILETVERYHLGAFVRGALAEGKLSGKYFGSAPQFSPEDIRHGRGAERWDYRAFERVRPGQLSMTAFALRYLLDFPSTHSVVLGGRSIEQYQAALAALDVPPLSPAVHCGAEVLRGGFAVERKARRVLSRVS